MKLKEVERELLLEWYYQAQEAFSDAGCWRCFDECLEEKFGYYKLGEQQRAYGHLAAAMARLEKFLNTPS